VLLRLSRGQDSLEAKAPTAQTNGAIILECFGRTKAGNEKMHWFVEIYPKDVFGVGYAQIGVDRYELTELFVEYRLKSVGLVSARDGYIMITINRRTGGYTRYLSYQTNNMSNVTDLSGEDDKGCALAQRTRF